MAMNKESGHLKVVHRIVFGDGADYVIYVDGPHRQLMYITDENLAMDMFKHGYKIDGLTLVTRKDGAPYIRATNANAFPSTPVNCFTFSPVQKAGESRKEFYKGSEFADLCRKMTAKYGSRRKIKEMRVFIADRFKD